VTQCGCAVGQRCIIGPETMEMCYTAGTDPPGTTCPSDADNCQPQGQCFGSGATFVCRVFCYTADDCPEGRPCNMGIRDITNPDGTGIKICGDPPVACDPFTGTGCPTGEGCTVDPTSGTTNCETAGTGTAGQACSTVGCVIGAACYSVGGGAATCYKYCAHTGAGPDCADVPGSTCANAIHHPTAGVCVVG
jgi:hypothetical protein